MDELFFIKNKLIKIKTKIIKYNKLQKNTLQIKRNSK